MDEWDEFLLKASEDVCMTAEVILPEEDTFCVKPSIIPEDLGNFGDNAEVLMQVARGESLNQLSSNGIWINSTSTNQSFNTSPSTSLHINRTNHHQASKRSLKNNVAVPPSVPIANTFQDFSRALVGHPLLSHPLSLLSKRGTSNYKQKFESNVSLYEIDSIGLFFYGSAGDSVKVESNVQDDFMKVIEMKRILLEKSIIMNDYENFNLKSYGCLTGSDSQIFITFENLKLLASSIPPNGKSSWLLPFQVILDNSINLTFDTIFYNSSATELFFDFVRNSIEDQLSKSSGLLEESDHFIQLEDNFKVHVKTKTPSFNISTNFRSFSHPDPSREQLNFLFYRQSNYSIEVDFDTLKISSIKSFVPKFDQQNRLFLLLKGLRNKLLTGKFAQGQQYFLAHTANCPFIRILSSNPIEGKVPFSFL